VRLDAGSRAAQRTSSRYADHVVRLLSPFTTPGLFSVFFLNLMARSDLSLIFQSFISFVIFTYTSLSTLPNPLKLYPGPRVGRARLSGKHVVNPSTT
jgi:hypothetical protein